MSTGAKIDEVQNGYYDVYRKLKDEGTLLVLDTGYTDDMSLSLYRDLIELCDYYVPNSKEAMRKSQHCPGTPFRCCQGILKSGCQA